jgi:hypothetical protein
MDITVSRLNERMALRVPSELPLGLVFIVGQIEGMQPYSGRPDEVALQLTEGEHTLPCRLPSQVVDEMQLAGHERVRAGGHLVFDPRQARYYLLARDIEVLPFAPDAVPHAIDIKPSEGTTREIVVETRASPTALAPGELPPWVRQLAPPEIQAELGLLAAELDQDGPEAKIEDDDFQLPPLPPEIVDYLSAAIDSDQDVELTPDVFDELAPAERHEPTPSPVLPAYREYDLLLEEVKEKAAIAPRVAVPERAVNDGGQNSSLLPLSSQQITLVLLASIFGFLFLVLLVLLIVALVGGFTLPLPV